MAVEDVTELIERLEAFEDRLGVRLDSVGAQLEPMYDDLIHLVLRGELHPANGTTIDNNLELIVAAYDSTSKIVGTSSQYIDASSFFGLETFEVTVQLYVSTISRIRIYPKLVD